MINLYEDTTKIDNTKPTAGIYYSTQKPTSDYVIARLVNPSKKITITNNDGNDTYVFKENGEFTFEFEDENGNKGSTLAKVDWIDKDIPTANVDYKLDGNKKLLILLDSISEDVYLLDKNNNKINYIEVKDKKASKISYLDSSNNVYKIADLDEKGNITKITYMNTTGKVSNVATYVTTLTKGEVSQEEYFDENGNSVTLTDAEVQELKKLQQARTNPLEYTFDDSGKYEFKLLDRASNIAYKTIKVDYLEDGNVMASDISYDITKITNKNVVATINPYMVNNEGEKVDVQIVNNDANNNYTFENNGEFTFKYKDASDTESVEIKEHKAKVDWIDKTAPTATIAYSTQTSTEKPVVANLTNESETIVIRNNGMNRQYTFTENGDFTFEFEDEAGNVGTAEAKVNWIKQTNNQEENTPDEQKPNTPNEQEPNEQEPNEPAEQEPNTPDDPDKNIEEKPNKNVTVGDANKDGKVTSTDLLLLKRHLVAGKRQEWILTGDKLKAIDINQDNKITATDLLLMNRLVLEQMKTH